MLCENGDIRNCKVECLTVVSRFGDEELADINDLLEETLDFFEEEGTNLADLDDLTEVLIEQLQDPSRPVELLVELVAGFQLYVGGEILRAAARVLRPNVGARFRGTCRIKRERCIEGQWVSQAYTKSYDSHGGRRRYEPPFVSPADAQQAADKWADRIRRTYCK